MYDYREVRVSASYSVKEARMDKITVGSIVFACKSGESSLAKCEELLCLAKKRRYEDGALWDENGKAKEGGFDASN